MGDHGTGICQEIPERCRDTDVFLRRNGHPADIIGNQPCLHISWLFNEAGRPSLTQKWVRAILDEFYGTEGIHGYGYGQDEDQGQLGAWYVISSPGIFDIKGLTAAEPSFALGAPLFDRVTIRLNPDYYPGGTFTIDAAGTHTSDSDDIASGNITTHPYAQSYTLNGTPLHTLRIPHVCGSAPLVIHHR